MGVPRQVDVTSPEYTLEITCTRVGNHSSRTDDHIVAVRVAEPIYRGCARRAEGSDISPRWLAKEPAVLAVELAGTLVSHLKRRTCGVQTIDEHTSPRGLQPKLLLILKRTHGRQRPEMVVQRG